MITVVLIDLVALGQIVIAWATAFNRDIVLHWMTTLVHALNALGH